MSYLRDPWEYPRDDGGQVDEEQVGMNPGDNLPRPRRARDVNPVPALEDLNIDSTPYSPPGNYSHSSGPMPEITPESGRKRDKKGKRKGSREDLSAQVGNNAPTASSGYGLNQATDYPSQQAYPDEQRTFYDPQQQFQYDQYDQQRQFQYDQQQQLQYSQQQQLQYGQQQQLQYGQQEYSYQLQPQLQQAHPEPQNDPSQTDNPVNDQDLSDMIDLAWTHTREGRFMDAERLYERLFDPKEGIYEGHPEMLQCLNSYSYVLSKLEKSKQAAKIQRRIEKLGGKGKGVYTAPTDCVENTRWAAYEPYGQESSYEDDEERELNTAMHESRETYAAQQNASTSPAAGPSANSAHAAAEYDDSDYGSPDEDARAGSSLLGLGVESRHEQQFLPYIDAPGSTLDSRFRVRPSDRFHPGEVFKMYWADPKGENFGTENFEFTGELGEKFFVTVRRFVIIATGEGNSTCVPIMTYSNRGLTKTGQKPRVHGVIYSNNKGMPSLPKGEPELGFPPVCMNVYESGESLTMFSRINYSKLTTVEHNTRVFFVGRLQAKDFDIARKAVDVCWQRKIKHPKPQNPSTKKPDGFKKKPGDPKKKQDKDDERRKRHDPGRRMR